MHHDITGLIFSMKNNLSPREVEGQNVERERDGELCEGPMAGEEGNGSLYK